MTKKAEITDDNNNLDHKNTQWHMALPSAIKLELMEYRHILKYQPEYLLNTKALQIDLLIIKKENDTIIKNEIGRIFKRHNIIEYKSPHDSAGVNTFFKVHAYACLYKVGKDGAFFEPEDITITIIRERKPIKLLKWFVQQGCSVEERYNGVYYISGAGFFTTQIIAPKELDEESHLWLKALTDSIDKYQARQLINKSKELLDGPEAEYVDSVLQVASKANAEIFDRIKKEDADMYSALIELMRPEIDEAVNEAVSEAVSEAVCEAVSDTEAKMTVEAIENLIKKLNMSKENACELMDITVSEYDEYKLRLGKSLGNL